MFFKLKNNSSQHLLILEQMNIEITLPDESIRKYNNPVTGEAIAFDIGPKLGKDAIAIEINKIAGKVIHIAKSLAEVLVTLSFEIKNSKNPSLCFIFK